MTASPYVRTGGQLRTSNQIQLILMQGVLDKGARFRFRALGFSMWPFIRHGDVLTVCPIDQRPLAAGQVVAFAMAGGGRLAVHRIVSARSGAVVVQGDNCPEPDGCLTPTEILGLVTQVERDGRRVRLWGGLAGVAIAKLNATGGLVWLKRAASLALRPPGYALRLLQRFAGWRALVRRFAPPVSIEAADAADLIAVQATLPSRQGSSASSDAPSSPRAPSSPDAPSGSDAPTCSGATYYVAKQGYALYGYVQLARYRDSTPYAGHWLWALTVRSRFRGLGLGQALALHVIRQAAAEGATALFLRVRADNRPARALYEQLGFVQVHVPGIDESPGQAIAATGCAMVTLCRYLDPGDRPAAPPVPPTGASPGCSPSAGG